MPIIESAPGAPDDPGRTRPGTDGPGHGAVTFRMFASARAAAGAGEVHVAPGPTAEVVAALAASLPARFADVMSASSLVADGHRLDHTSSAPIVGGTIVDVLPPFAGG
jgi:molybdopterin converting factor small subunit